MGIFGRNPGDRDLQTSTLVASGYRPYNHKTDRESLQVWAKSEQVIGLKIGEGRTTPIKMGRGFRISNYAVVLYEDDWGTTNIVDHAHETYESRG